MSDELLNILISSLDVIVSKSEFLYTLEIQKHQKE
jgi:hypothetical protein